MPPSSSKNSKKQSPREPSLLMHQLVSSPVAWLVIGTSFLLAVMAIRSDYGRFREEIHMNTMKSHDAVAPKSEHALVELDFGEGKRRLFLGEVNRHVYPFTAALTSVADAGKLTYRIHNARIDKIEGLGAPQGKWKVYRNALLADISLNDLFIRAGDRYTLQYERR